MPQYCTVQLCRGGISRSASWSRKSDTQQQQILTESVNRRRKRRTATATSVCKQQSSNSNRQNWGRKRRQQQQQQSAKLGSKETPSNWGRKGRPATAIGNWGPKRRPTASAIRQKLARVETRRTATATAIGKTGVERDAQQQQQQSAELGSKETPNSIRNRQHWGRKRRPATATAIGRPKERRGTRQQTANQQSFQNGQLESIQSNGGPHSPSTKNWSTSGTPVFLELRQAGQRKVAQHLKNGFSRRIPASLSHSPSSS